MYQRHPVEPRSTRTPPPRHRTPRHCSAAQRNAPRNRSAETKHDKSTRNGAGMNSQLDTSSRTHGHRPGRMWHAAKILIVVPLVLACAGGASAAGLLITSSKQIKNGVIAQ